MLFLGAAEVGTVMRLATAGLQTQQGLLVGLVIVPPTILVKVIVVVLIIIMVVITTKLK